MRAPERLLEPGELRSIEDQIVAVGLAVVIRVRSAALADDVQPILRDQRVDRVEPGRRFR